MNHPLKAQDQRLYRSIDNCKILGVCAGLAQYYNMSPAILRVVAFLLIFLGGPLTILIYLFLALIIDKRPYQLDLPGYEEEEIMLAKRIPRSSLKSIQIKLDQLEKRLRHAESYITSKGYQLGKEYKNL